MSYKKILLTTFFSLRKKIEWLGCITFCLRMQEDRDDIVKYVYEESEKNDQ